MRATEEAFHKGISALNRRKFADAARFFKQVLRSEPNHVSALNLLTVALMSTDRFAEAQPFIAKAISLVPGSDASHYNFGLILRRLNKPTQALQQFNEALRINPDVPETWNNRGTIFNDLTQYEDAIFDFDRAILLNPNYSEALANKGKSLTRLKRYEEASATYDKALTLKPNLAEAWLGRGNVYTELRRFNEAFAAYDKALALKPDLAEAWLGRGRILSEFKRFDEAFAAYDKALALKPELAEAWLARGNGFTELKRFDQAFAAYDRALSLRPDLEFAESARLHTKMILCDWAKFEEECLHVLTAVREQKLVSSPFILLSIPSSPADQLQSARTLIADQGLFSALWRGEIYSHGRIRVAYISADFRNHAVAYLTAGLFEHHDRSCFEITGISIGAADDSPLRRRLESAFDHFIDAKDKTQADIANLIRDREIDIAVDLMGHTQNSQPGILARRPAPIQINYLGYAGTLGARYIDYILADSTVVPEEHRAFFTEQVVWLPDSYLVSDDRRAISPQTPTRHECGLPEDGFVFCSFNNSYKIAPNIFELWMRLVRTTPNSVLWLSQTNTIAMANLRREAERHGVSSERLIFAPKVAENADHLARQRLADLFLDTLPYNAHTTASDSLWVGLPVLTCLGKTFAGRVAASLLRAVGLPELIATSLQEYEALALKFVHDPTLLTAMKAKLAQRREIYPLFDTGRFTRHIEGAYVTMWERYQRLETPQAFAVDPINY